MSRADTGCSRARNARLRLTEERQPQAQVVDDARWDAMRASVMSCSKIEALELDLRRVRRRRGA